LLFLVVNNHGVTNTHKHATLQNKGVCLRCRIITKLFTHLSHLFCPFTCCILDHSHRLHRPT